MINYSEAYGRRFMLCVLKLLVFILHHLCGPKKNSPEFRACEDAVQLIKEIDYRSSEPFNV